MKRKFHLTITETILLGIAVLFFLSYLYINIFGFDMYATADVYADTLYAIEAWESKSIFPEGWVFGNQFYVVATPVFCALLYGITGNINLSMIIATLIMTVLLIASLIWMLLPFTNRTQQIASAALMLGGITTCGITLSLEGQLLFVLASYYSCYLITLFITIGDYLRALHHPQRNYYSPMTILCCLLLLATGMQSIRQTVILIAPLCALEVLRLGAHWWQHRKFSRDTLLITCRVALYSVSNFLGLIIIRLLNIDSISIYGDSLFRTSGWAQAHQANLRILGKITGFYYAFTEANGWMYFIPALIFCSMILYTFGKGTYHFLKSKKAQPLFTVQVFFIIGLLILFVANLVLQIEFRTPYMFTWYGLLTVSVASLFNNFKTAPVRLLTVILTVGFTLNWWVSCKPMIAEIRETDTNSEYKMIAEYLSEKDIEYIYGDWFTSATRIALLSNGKLKACSYHENVFQILPYINPQQYYGEDENRNAVYIFRKNEESAALLFADQKGVTMTKMAEFPHHTLYTSEKPLMYHK